MVRMTLILLQCLSPAVLAVIPGVFPLMDKFGRGSEDPKQPLHSTGDRPSSCASLSSDSDNWDHERGTCTYGCHSRWLDSGPRQDNGICLDWVNYLLPSCSRWTKWWPGPRDSRDLGRTYGCWHPFDFYNNFNTTSNWTSQPTTLWSSTWRWTTTFTTTRSTTRPPTKSTWTTTTGTTTSWISTTTWWGFQGQESGTGPTRNYQLQAKPQHTFTIYIRTTTSTWPSSTSTYCHFTLRQ